MRKSRSRNPYSRRHPDGRCSLTQSTTSKKHSMSNKSSSSLKGTRLWRKRKGNFLLSLSSKSWRPVAGRQIKRQSSNNRSKIYKRKLKNWLMQTLIWRLEWVTLTRSLPSPSKNCKSRRTRFARSYKKQKKFKWLSRSRMKSWNLNVTLRSHRCLSKRSRIVSRRRNKLKSLS